jgi:hypothetical protein
MRVLSGVGITALALAFVAGCEKPLDLATLPEPDTVVRDTSYVELWPRFGGFTGPEDVMVGNDQLLYVADTKANRIVMLNRAGQVLSTRSMLHPRSLGQTSRLDLLVGGEVVSASGDTAGAIFRMHLVSTSPDSAHRLDVARIDTVWAELAHPARRFPGLAVFGDNNYLAARTGPDNSSFVDPDGRVLLFDSNDHFVTPIPGLATRTGSGITDIYYPTGLTSFPGVYDFILTQSSEGVAYGAIWMKYEQSTEFNGWLPKFDPENPVEENVDFIVPNRFLLPEGVTIDKVRRDVFIADAGLDSIVKFNSRGRFKSESFGFYRTAGTMKRPTGLAFFDKILYVLDETDGTIIRYRLSTDIPR